MCVPQAAIPAIQAIVGLTAEVGMGIATARREAKTNEYRTQAALNNVKIAQNEALRQQQLGINAARQEKIDGIRERNMMIAKNAASGFNIDSGTNLYNYQDTIDKANLNADIVKNSYDIKADSYFNQANSYLSGAGQYQTEYKNSLFNTAHNTLGGMKKVADDWYKVKKKEAEAGIKSGGYYDYI